MDLINALEAFGLNDSPVNLSGGSRPTFRVGDIILKQVQETSLENNHSPQLMEWIAEWSNEIKEDGFRFPKAIQTKDGEWITDDGWTGWKFVEGGHLTKDAIPTAIKAIIAFHNALKGISQNPLMDNNQTEWGKADKSCWEDKPLNVNPNIKQYIDELYNLRQPAGGLENQLIHGDLNPENILISPNQPPAFIDFSPFWRPVKFALGMFANWVGPRQGDISVLEYFQDIKEFDQMLIRASIRMLLVMNNFDDWENSSEKKATELVIEYIKSKGNRF